MKTRDMILKVAEEEFSKVGFNSLSMNDLVKKLNVNKATIYYHFSDKKALYNEIMSRGLNELNSNIKSIFNANLEGETLLKSYVNAVVISLKARPTLIPMGLREMANFGVNIEEYTIPHIKETIQYLQTILNKLNLKNKYKELSPYAMHSFIHGTISNFYILQMSSLDIGIESNLKQDCIKTLDYISNLVSNILLDAIIKNKLDD